MLDEKQTPRLRRWQALTVTLLVIGYAGYYLCRSNFSVALPLIIDDLVASGWDANGAKVSLGALASLGVLAYAIGKFLSGGLADLLGGRRAFLLGTAGAACCTALFALGGGFPVFTLSWILNRLLQSTGWPGVVKLAARWLSFSSYGAAMGFISLSYLFGDAAARRFMGWLIEHGIGWRGVFCAWEACWRATRWRASRSVSAGKARSQHWPEADCYQAWRRRCSSLSNGVR
jgi:sugar phosphate permease